MASNTIRTTVATLAVAAAAAFASSSHAQADSSNECKSALSQLQSDNGDLAKLMTKIGVDAKTVQTNCNESEITDFTKKTGIRIERHRVRFGTTVIEIPSTPPTPPSISVNTADACIPNPNYHADTNGTNAFDPANIQKMTDAATHLLDGVTTKIETVHTDGWFNGNVNALTSTGVSINHVSQVGGCLQNTFDKTDGGPRTAPTQYIQNKTVLDTLIDDGVKAANAYGAVRAAEALGSLAHAANNGQLQNTTVNASGCSVVALPHGSAVGGASATTGTQQLGTGNLGGNNGTQSQNTNFGTTGELSATGGGPASITYGDNPVTGATSANNNCAPYGAGNYGLDQNATGTGAVITPGSNSTVSSPGGASSPATPGTHHQHADLSLDRMPVVDFLGRVDAALANERTSKEMGITDVILPKSYGATFQFNYG